MNDDHIAQARQDVDKYKKDAEADLKDYERKMKDYIKDLQNGVQSTQPEAPKLKPVPKIAEADKLPEDLSSYINFLHPWGNILLDPFVLMLMFFGLVIATIITLRAQDIL